MKNLCYNRLSVCMSDGENFILKNKKTGKEFSFAIKDNPNYAMSLIAKWGFNLYDNVKESELIIKKG